MHWLPPHAVSLTPQLGSGDRRCPGGERCQQTLVPRDIGGVRDRPAPYLQQVKLGHEAPRQMQEAVPSVRESYRHDRPTRPRTR